MAHEPAPRTPTVQSVPVKFPWLTLELMLLSTDGGVSATATPVACPGPALVTTIVKAMASPTMADALSTTLLSARSAESVVELVVLVVVLVVELVVVVVVVVELVVVVEVVVVVVLVVDVVVVVVDVVLVVVVVVLVVEDVVVVLVLVVVVVSVPVINRSSMKTSVISSANVFLLL